MAGHWACRAFFIMKRPALPAKRQRRLRRVRGSPRLHAGAGLYYNTTVYVELTVPAGTQVYYTVDGSTPTEASTPYNGERLG